MCFAIPLPAERAPGWAPTSWRGSMTGERSALSLLPWRQSLAQPGHPAKTGSWGALTQSRRPHPNTLVQSLARRPGKGRLPIRLGTPEALKRDSCCPNSAFPQRFLSGSCLSTPRVRRGGWEAPAARSELPSLPVGACSLLKRLVSSCLISLRMAQPRL